jgi:SAM-dependent methyltransferase
MKSYSKQLYKRSLGARLALARRIVAIHYIQPATALWRLFEVEVVLEKLCGQGRGLDLGCGDGTLATVLFQNVPGIRWTGLDLDPHDAALAEGKYERIHVASAAAIPEPDDAFDLVFSNSALEHMDGLDAVLAEVRRVLKPGGRFVFTVPEASFRDQLFWPRVLGCFGRKTASTYVRHLDERIAHVNYLSPAEWRERLARHGFQSETEVAYLSRRVIGWWETLSNLTGGLAYLLTGGRKSTRQIQRAAGLLRKERPWLGLPCFIAMLPVLLNTAAESRPRSAGALYVEAVKLS